MSESSVGRKVAMWCATMLPVLSLIGYAFQWPAGMKSLVDDNWWAVISASAIIYSPSVLSDFATKFGTNGNNAGTQAKREELSADPYAVGVNPDERP